MRIELSEQSIDALAEIISGSAANGYEPSIGLYRQGWRLEAWFKGFGVPIDVKGESRLPATKTAIRGAIFIDTGSGELLKRIIESSADPRDFITEPERHAAVVEYLNKHLFYDGLKLERASRTMRLWSHPARPLRVPQPSPARHLQQQSHHCPRQDQGAVRSGLKDRLVSAEYGARRKLDRRQTGHSRGEHPDDLANTASGYAASASTSASSSAATSANRRERAAPLAGRSRAYDVRLKRIPSRSPSMYPAIVSAAMISAVSTVWMYRLVTVPREWAILPRSMRASRRAVSGVHTP